MIEAAILLDPANEWLSSYLPDRFTRRDDIRVRIFDDPSLVRSFDIVFVLGYTKILPKSFSDRNGMVLLVHESDLPKGKGFAPVQWQILEGKSKIIVSLVELHEKVDSGDIFLQTYMKLDGSELYDEIRSAQASATFELVGAALDRYPNLQRHPQAGEATFYRRRIPSDNEIDVDKTIRSQFDLLRVANNDHWPSHFYLNGMKYILKIYKEK